MAVMVMVGERGVVVKEAAVGRNSPAAFRRIVAAVAAPGINRLTQRAYPCRKDFLRIITSARWGHGEDAAGTVLRAGHRAGQSLAKEKKKCVLIFSGPAISIRIVCV